MDTATDIIESDAAASSVENSISFGKEIAKNLTISAAQTAGAIGGLLVVGLAYSAVQSRRNKKRVALTIVTNEPAETTETETA